MKPIMRYHGGKFRIAPWIQSFFPDHHTYVEVFGGAAGVLLQKPASKSEVYNDLDKEIVNVFRVLRNKNQSTELERQLRLTPYAREEFNISYEPTDCPIERARRTLIRAHMGFGSAGATKHKTGFRIDSAREYGTAAHLWSEYPDEIQFFHARLQSVLIENKPAIELLKNHDREDTLFFVDPPYMHDTRVMGGHGQYYQHEMSNDEHSQLLTELQSQTGMIILSGYDSELYNDSLSDWQKHQIKARISAKRGTGIRTETVWLNPACASKQKQQQLFA